jgi:hypothetical protein
MPEEVEHFTIKTISLGVDARQVRSVLGIHEFVGDP